MDLFGDLCLICLGICFFSRFFGTLGFGLFSAICFGIWGFGDFFLRDLFGDLMVWVFLRDLFGDLGICGPLVWGFLFRDLFGDLGILLSRFVWDLGICFFRDLFVDLGIVFFSVICLGIWGFVFVSRFVWGFGDLCFFFT